MDEDQLVNLIIKDPYAKKGFVGVFSRTRIPITNIFPASYIINLDEYGSKGFHWIGLYITSKYITIFDSFGGNYLNDGMFRSFINSFYNKNRELVSSPVILQDYNSSTCGMYCVLFIWFSARGYSLHEFLTMFTKNKIVNDEGVELFFKTYHNTVLSCE